jgi:DNA-directed RNA polymerase subunit RPC12/RpoP
MTEFGSFSEKKDDPLVKNLMNAFTSLAAVEDTIGHGDFDAISDLDDAMHCIANILTDVSVKVYIDCPYCDDGVSRAISEEKFRCYKCNRMFATERFNETR